MNDPMSNPMHKLPRMDHPHPPISELAAIARFARAREKLDAALDRGDQVMARRWSALITHTVHRLVEGSVQDTGACYAPSTRA